VPGFTLVEMLMVVAIIGIMSAVLLPAATNYLRTYQIRGAAQQAGSLLQAARLKAVTHSVNLGVVFVPGSTATSSAPQNQTMQWAIEDDAFPQTPHCPAAAPGPSWSIWGNECGGGAAGFANLLLDPYQASPVSALPTAVTFVATTNCKAPNGTAFPAATEWGIRFNKFGAACGVSSTCTPHLLATNYYTTPYVFNNATGAFAGTSTGDLSMCLSLPQFNLNKWVTVSSGGRILVQP
jgi:prepilin-type N-terminal cleavage/methylation domain-containing protein